MATTSVGSLRWHDAAHRVFIPLDPRALPQPLPSAIPMHPHSLPAPLPCSALFMSLQELSFGVLWQRAMYQPLRVRLFYGHPDVANKVFFTTRGGFAKASKIVNVSEDVFGGFIAALRGGGELPSVELEAAAAL